MGNIIKSFQVDTRPFVAYEPMTLEEMAPLLDGDDVPLTPEMVLAQARAEAERKVQEAYAEGVRQGIEAGKAQFAEAVGHSAQALARMAQVVQEARQAYLASLEPDMAKLAHAIAARILHREARTDRDLILATIRAALANLLDREHLAVRVNPADLDALRNQKVALLEEFGGIDRLDLVADASVEPGGCLAESDTLHVDATLDGQLQRILDALAE